MRLAIDPHPSLYTHAFVTESDALGGESPSWLTRLLQPGADSPLSRDEHTRSTIRDLLRHGGYKPTGRGKPASEYLVRAAGEGKLPSINLAVDLCNAVSLHSGLPVSVVDLDRASPPLRVGIADPGTRYIFNASGQELDASGLLCLFDNEGACANAVKDAQRTKTNPDTSRTCSILWGHRDLSEQVDKALAWYQELLARTGAQAQMMTG